MIKSKLAPICEEVTFRCDMCDGDYKTKTTLKKHQKEAKILSKTR
jgi:ribosomal protein L31